MSTKRSAACAQAHKWEFKARFRRNAFGWKSQPAITRVKQAVGEIKKVAKKEPLLAPEGAVVFLERVSPALEHVDSSSGAIGTVVVAHNGRRWWKNSAKLIHVAFPISYFDGLGLPRLAA